jgi:acylphosphatase
MASMASDPDTAARARLRIHGRVQGVFFRGSMCDEARRAGVGGWVRNCRDGTVEAVVEGPRPAVERLIAWAHLGPAGALVTDVEIEWQPPSGEFVDFGIRR